MSDDVDFAGIAQELRRLSRGDFSVLVHAVAQPGGDMMTTEGSANDSVWSRMEESGWMTSRLDARSLPNGAAVRLKIFSITEAGRAPLAEMIAHIARMERA